MPRPKVLFLCTHNSARSQMAEGLLRHFAGDRFEVLSAGTAPTEVNPYAVEAMKEIGIDISRHHSKSVTEFLGQNIGYVVTVCDSAKERCPIFPQAFRRLHWSLDDPSAAEGTRDGKLAVFRRVRDELENRIREFVSQTH